MDSQVQIDIERYATKKDLQDFREVVGDQQYKKAEKTNDRFETAKWAVAGGITVSVLSAIILILIHKGMI